MFEGYKRSNAQEIQYTVMIVLKKNQIKTYQTKIIDEQKRFTVRKHITFDLNFVFFNEPKTYEYLEILLLGHQNVECKLNRFDNEQKLEITKFDCIIVFPKHTIVVLII